MDADVTALLDAVGLESDVDIHEVVFGDSSEMQNELAELVVSGKKRATAALVRTYEVIAEPLPSAGMLFLIRDGRGRPRCLCRMTDVRIRAFSDVDESFAKTEGEGDGSLRFWREVHRAFFERDAERNGYAFGDDSLVLLQCFDVIATP